MGREKALLVGCGSTRDRRITIGSRRSWEGLRLVTLDRNPDHFPDVVHDLEELPYPFETDEFAEVHAYEVLEHLGRQGDWRSFFAQFSELWRILKPGGHLCGTCPSWRSMWAWGDPSHTRILTAGTLVFLSQEEYETQIGKTPMTDFRDVYRADFRTRLARDDGESFAFAIEAVKPSGWRPIGERLTAARRGV